MKLKQLLKTKLNLKKETLNFLFEYYYSDKPKSDRAKCIKKYSKVWDELLTLRAKKADFTIVIDYIEADGENEGYYAVHGLPLDGSLKSDGSPETWALEMTDWREWLGAEVDASSYLPYLPWIEVFSHILWEMTWHGFSNDCLTLARLELKKLAGDVMSGKEPIYKAKTNKDGEWVDEKDGIPKFKKAKTINNSSHSTRKK